MVKGFLTASGVSFTDANIYDQTTGYLMTLLAMIMRYPGARSPRRRRNARHPQCHPDSRLPSVNMSGWPDPSYQGVPDCPSCGPPPDPTQSSPVAPGFKLEWAMKEPPPPEDSCRLADDRPLCATCRSTLAEVLDGKHATSATPDRVLAVSADLGRPFGSHLLVSSVEVWPTWFDLRLSGDHNGPWRNHVFSGSRGMLWSAEDDRGGRYVGAKKGGSSDPNLCNVDLMFTPTLDPEARALTLVFPASFGDGTVLRTTIDLPPPE